MKSTINIRATRVMLIILFLSPGFAAIAHNINYALQDAPATNVAWFYIKLGFTHIIPQGLDHVLFIIALCLMNNRIKTIIWQASAFTLAHTITLTLSIKQILTVPTEIIEPLIALSIIFIAIENLLFTTLKPHRIGIIFLFGLLHGMGFASVLNETGLPPNQFVNAIIAFNIGVELGQVAVILLFFACIVFPLKHKPYFKKVVTYPISAVVALIATYWSIERIFY